MTAINVALDCGILESRLEVYLGIIMKGDQIEWSQITNEGNQLKEESSCYSIDERNMLKLSTQDLLKLNRPVQLVITGDVFTAIQRQLLESSTTSLKAVLALTKVFARMKPNNKGDLMLLLKSDKHNCVAFCGDGTNDTCALKAADVGLSLSVEDASLAAPFTSSIFNISSMVTLIKEGRACLVTSVECFKFMTLYSCI